MSPTKRKGTLLALLLAPCLCCFIGVGALLHVAVSTVQVQVRDDAALRRRMDESQKAAAAIKDEIGQTERRIADLRAQLAAEREHTEAAGKLQEELRRLLARKAELEASVAAWREKLEKARSLLAQERSSLDQGQKQASQSKTQVEEAESKLAASQRNAAEAERELADALRAAEQIAQSRVNSDQLQRLLAEKQESLAAAQAEAKRLDDELKGLQREREEKEKTVEVQHLKGTRRWNAPTPLYVECHDAGVTLQPAGTRCRWHPDSDEQESFLQAAAQQRYVLFLIRPNGFESFFEYRQLVLSRAKQPGGAIEHGYEPVNSDSKLVYPN